MTNPERALKASFVGRKPDIMGRFSTLSRAEYISRIVRKEIPTVEMLHGSWAGPGWKQAEERAAELSALLPQEVA